ncbi:MAG: AAA family ATPase [Methanoregula sp.]
MVGCSWIWAGSKWWKFDFHTHTPKSEDYGKGHNQAFLKSITPKEWLLKFMIAGIDCVAITDHNSGDWIDELKIALDILRTEKPTGYKELYLFSGAEISVYGGIHILAIFSGEKSKEDIDSLLGEVEYNGERGKCDTCTQKTASAVIKIIESRNGIAIPAHVDQLKGLFKEFEGITLAQVLNCDILHANEIFNKNFNHPQLYHERNLNWSSVIGSDSHHPDNSIGNSPDKYPGSHYTWVKMSKPTVEGLRLALLDGNSLSIKRSDECPTDPNEFDHMTIEGIIIKKAKYIGQGEGREFKCNFNPWLNTIVGGRGTGKSTILELIRISLDRKEELPKSLENDFKKYSEISISRESEGLLTNETEVELIIRKDGIRFKINWQSATQEAHISEEKNLDVWEIVEGNIKQRFPIQIFSQKQIFELSKDPAALLKKIDSAQKVGYRQWEEERKQLETKYLSLQAQIREKSNILENESTIRGEIDDIDHRLRLFEDKGYSDVLKNYSSAQLQENILDKWKNSWIESDEKLAKICREIVPHQIDNHILEGSPEFQEIHDEIINNFSGIQEKIKIIVKEINETIQNGLKIIDESKLSQEIGENQTKYLSLKEDLEAKGIFSLNEYNKFLERKQDLNLSLMRIVNTKQEILMLEESVADCFTQLKSKREEIQTKRNDFLRELLSDNQSVSIRIIPFGNKQKVESEFRKLIEKEDGRFETDITNLLKKVHDDPIEGISTLKDTVKKIRSQDFSNISDKRFGEHILRLDPEKIDRIMCFFPEDSLDVQYYDPKKRGFISIKQGSPGQKNAALLAFLLIYGNEPLILDQPEDDLDNQLIYDSIVAQLREIKRKRQVIVVTHNANVVVNGDSENVIPLYVSSSAQTEISGEGGLQEYEVRKKVCEILEGGKEAFESRYKRINVSE